MPQQVARVALAIPQHVAINVAVKPPIHHGRVHAGNGRVLNLAADKGTARVTHHQGLVALRHTESRAAHHHQLEVGHKLTVHCQLDSQPGSKPGSRLASLHSKLYYTGRPKACHECGIATTRSVRRTILSLSVKPQYPNRTAKLQAICIDINHLLLWAP